jgi:hypothetical protein
MALPYKLFSGVSCSDISIIVPLYWGLANGNPSIAQIVTDGFGGYYSVTTGAINSSSFSENDQLVTVSIGTNSCPGVVSRPFSYNPEQSIIDGTYNIGTMCVGVDQLIYYNSPGGLTWWGGPNENQGYCIGTVVPEQNQSTPLGDIGNVKFWRTSIFTDSSFLKLVEEATGLIFENTMDAIFYLDDNNYWTSYPAERFYFVVSNRWSRPKGYDHIDFGTVIPNSTPAYRLYLKPGPQNIGVNNYTLIATDNYGSPPKLTNFPTKPNVQYLYGKHAWLTDVRVYKKGGTIVYTFPNGGTTTYGTAVYQNIVLPYI